MQAPSNEKGSRSAFGISADKEEPKRHPGLVFPRRTLLGEPQLLRPLHVVCEIGVVGVFGHQGRGMGPVALRSANGRLKIERRALIRSLFALGRHVWR